MKAIYVRGCPPRDVGEMFLEAMGQRVLSMSGVSRIAPQLQADFDVCVRTTNLLELLFGEGRRKTKVIPCFPTEASGLRLVYAGLITASRRWKGVKMSLDI